MATVAFGGLIDAAPEFRARVLEAPVFLFGEMDTDPEFRAAFQPAKELSGAVAVDSEWLAAMRVEVAFGGAVEADAEFALWSGEAVAFAGAVEGETGWLAAFRRANELAGAVEADAEFAAALRVPALLSGRAEAAPEFRASFGFAFPELPEPLPGALPGVVNLARNPSLEASQDDWDVLGGGLQWTFDETAWSGDGHTLWETDAGEVGVLTIGSQPGLLVPGGTAWGAVVALDVPDGVEVLATLEAVHADATVAAGEDATIVGPTGGWAVVVVPAVVADAGKVLDRLRLVLGTDNGAGADPVVVRADGVQFARFADGYDVYADGSMGPGYGWLGVPHASPSVRRPAA